jgi:hypothetical protein
VTGAKQIRRFLETGIAEALSRHSFRREGGSEVYASDDLLESPLRAHLVISVESDKYGEVRVAGSGEIVVPEVDEFLATVPADALTRVQNVYRGKVPFALAREDFDNMDGVDRRAPLEWSAARVDDAPSVLAEFTAFVDGPVMRWFEGLSTVEAVRAAVVRGRSDPQHGDLVRAVAAHDALNGRRDDGLELLRAHLSAPHERADSPERVQAFIDWLTAHAPGARSSG